MLWESDRSRSQLLGQIDCISVYVSFVFNVVYDFFADIIGETNYLGTAVSSIALYSRLQHHHTSIKLPQLQPYNIIRYRVCPQSRYVMRK